MKQYKVYRDGILTNQLPYNTEEELAHVEKCKSLELFGITELWEDQQVLISAAILGEEGDEIVPAVYETQSIKIRDAEYTVEILENYIDQAQINAEARAYLAATDFYVIRNAETGAAIPAEITDARAAARASII